MAYIIAVVFIFKRRWLMKVDSNTQTSYEQLSSMKSINKAADNAAGLAISQEMKAQVSGDGKAVDNMSSADNMVKTAEGSLNSIHDSLQRMRDLSVQASHGTLSKGDKQIIQTEIDQLKQDIGDTVKNTKFNTQTLLDGSFSNKNIAANPEGTGMKMSIKNTGLKALGIEDFDVTKSFDVSTIDKAITKVSDARSNLGALSNSMAHGINVTQVAQENQADAASAIEDLNVPNALSQLSSRQILQQYKIFAQKQTLSAKSGILNLLG
jgi:flagellin